MPADSELRGTLLARRDVGLMVTLAFGTEAPVASLMFPCNVAGGLAGKAMWVKSRKQQKKTLPPKSVRDKIFHILTPLQCTPNRLLLLYHLQGSFKRRRLDTVVNVAELERTSRDRLQRRPISDETRRGGLETISNKHPAVTGDRLMAGGGRRA